MNVFTIATSCISSEYTPFFYNLIPASMLGFVEDEVWLGFVSTIIRLMCCYKTLGYSYRDKNNFKEICKLNLFISEDKRVNIIIITK